MPILARWMRMRSRPLEETLLIFASFVVLYDTLRLRLPGPQGNPDRVMQNELLSQFAQSTTGARQGPLIDDELC